MLRLKINLIFGWILVFSNPLFAQLNPAITHWIINTTGQTGFDGIPTNVQQVQYSANNVYVSTTNIADWIPVGYDWPNNPWYPQNMNFVFKITLNPRQNTGTPIETPYGHIGIWTNGVSIYNPKDANSYQNQNVWYQNAFFFEHLNWETMDSCLGHPNGMYEYHLHVHPKCLWNETDSTVHAPLIGFAFDGFPIYGGYGFTNTNGTGPIKRMRSSYRLRSMTDRTTLPDGTVLGSSDYGPALSVYPLGAYIEDYEYVAGLGDLDDHNGRYCVTPEYPSGTYAYFVTLDEQLQPQFPYVLGLTYYGRVQPGNTGPSSGYNTITETVSVYTSVNDIENKLLFKVYPNPSSESFSLYLIPSYNSNCTVSLIDGEGRVVRMIENVQTAVNYTFDVTDLKSGLYLLRIQTESGTATSRLSVLH